MDWIADVAWHKADEINVLITSRRERDIETAWQDIGTGSICIQSAVVDADIKLYVRSQLSRDQALKAWPDSVKKDIEKTLAEGAHGM